MQQVVLNAETKVATVVTPFELANVQVPLFRFYNVLLEILGKQLHFGTVENPLVRCVVSQFLLDACTLVHCVFQLTDLFLEILCAKYA
jgi:hypothetical protein